MPSKKVLDFDELDKNSRVGKLGNEPEDLVTIIKKTHTKFRLGDTRANDNYSSPREIFDYYEDFNWFFLKKIKLYATAPLIIN